MKLYIHPASPNCVKVLMAASLLGVRLDIEVVDLPSGAQRSPEFLALNPNGRVPVLVDGGFVLWEANAILQYLAADQPAPALWPADLRAQADVTHWLSWDLAYLAAAVRPFQWERMLKPMLGLGGPDAAVLEAAAEPLARCAGVLDQALAGRAWLVGNALTLADVSVACRLMYAEAARLPLDGHGEVRRWREAIAATDAWRTAQPAPFARQ